MGLFKKRMLSPVQKKRSFMDASTLIVIALTLWGAWSVYQDKGINEVWHVLFEDIWLFTTIISKVLLGCLIGAFITLLMPRELVLKYVGDNSGLKGLLLSTLIGAMLPTGPYTIFPMAMTFKTMGVSTGSTIAFITSWTLLGFNRFVVWEIPFFGADLVFTRLLLSFLMPIVAGYIAQKLEEKWF